MEKYYQYPSLGEPKRLAPPYLIGNSHEISEIRKDIKKVGNTDLTVLVLGATGTGKGLLALSLHNNSARRQYPFVSINCANIPHLLMESEMFGYKKGAFTGAWRDKIGKFELASNGTIFLDEIAEMPLNMQAKLLQVLQDGEFTSIGGLDTIKINVRTIAATNSNPKYLTSSGNLRIDLYYRMAVICFYLPSLKERKEDVFPLATYFLEKYTRMYNKKIMKPTNKMWEMLESYDWPGNVRELENIIKSYVVLESEEIFVETMMNKMKRDNKKSTNESHGQIKLVNPLENMNLRQVVDRERQVAERRIINKVLLSTNGNKKKTAELLQVSYKCILNKIKQYGL